MSVDKYLDRRYNLKTYNCVHFACDVYENETGKNIHELFYGLLLARAERFADFRKLRKLTKHKEPVSPCIVLFQAPKTEPHVGIFIRDRVLHIQPDGVKFEELSVTSAFYSKVSFYTC